jgi:hypothetical protein
VSISRITCGNPTFPLNERNNGVGHAQAEPGRLAVHFADQHLMRVEHGLHRIKELVQLGDGQR